MEKLDNKMEEARKSIDENRANQGAIFIKDPKKRRKCPLCKQNLYLYYVSFEEMFLMCENDYCDFPFGYEVLQIVRDESELRENPDKATKDLFEYPTAGGNESLTIGSMLSCTTSCASDCDGLSTISTICDADDLSLMKQEIFSAKLSKQNKERQKQKQKDDELELDLNHTKQLTETINQLDKDVEFIKKITSNKSWMKNLKVWEVVTGRKLTDNLQFCQKDVEYSLSQPSGSGASPIINIQIFNEKTPMQGQLFLETQEKRKCQKTPENDKKEEENQKIPVSSDKEVFPKIHVKVDKVGEFLKLVDDKKEVQCQQAPHNDGKEGDTNSLPNNDNRKGDFRKIPDNNKKGEKIPMTPNNGNYENTDFIHKIPDYGEKELLSPMQPYNDGNGEEVQKISDEVDKEDEFIKTPHGNENRDQNHMKPNNNEQEVQSLKPPQYNGKEEVSQKTPSDDRKEEDIQKVCDRNVKEREYVKPMDEKEFICRDPPHNDRKEREIQMTPYNNEKREELPKTPECDEKRDKIPDSNQSQKPQYNNGKERGIQKPLDNNDKGLELSKTDHDENKDLINDIPDCIQSHESPHNDLKVKEIQKIPDNNKKQKVLKQETQKKPVNVQNREQIHEISDNSEKESQKMPHNDEKDDQSQKTPPNYRKQYQTRKSPRNLGINVQKICDKHEEDEAFLKTQDNDEKAMENQKTPVKRDDLRPKTPRTYGKKYQKTEIRKSPRNHGNNTEVKR